MPLIYYFYQHVPDISESDFCQKSQTYYPVFANNAGFGIKNIFTFCKRWRCIRWFTHSFHFTPVLNLRLSGLVLLFEQSLSHTRPNYTLTNHRFSEIYSFFDSFVDLGCLIYTPAVSLFPQMILYIVLILLFRGLSCIYQAVAQGKTLRASFSK